MKYIKNIKLLMLAGLLLQVGTGFAYNSDWQKQGQRIEEALKCFAETPVPKLIEAAEKGNLEELRSALDSPETNINDVDKHGATALMYAVRRGRKDIVELLIDKGADPHIITWGDKTALREAVKGGHKEIIKLLLATNSEFKKRSMGCALIEAAEKGHKDIVELLINQGADPNSTACADDPSSFPTDTTALIEAAGKGHKDIVMLLLDKGADINSKRSTTDNTALIQAIARDHKDIAKLLLDKGANPHIANVHGNTALQIAERKGYKEIVQLIKQ